MQVLPIDQYEDAHMLAPRHRLLKGSQLNSIYGPIAFDKRVNFQVQCARSVPCACVCCISCVCNCVMVICEPHMKIMQYTHTHKAVTGRVEVKSYSLVEGNCTIGKSCAYL